MSISVTFTNRTVGIDGLIYYHTVYTFNDLDWDEDHQDSSFKEVNIDIVEVENIGRNREASVFTIDYDYVLPISKTRFRTCSGKYTLHNIHIDQVYDAIEDILWHTYDILHKTVIKFNVSAKKSRLKSRSAFKRKLRDGRKENFRNSFSL